MLRQFLLVTALSFFVLTLYSQKKANDFADDIGSQTKIEQLLKETSVSKKVEFIKTGKVGVLNFLMVVVNNLKTGVKLKGLYLSNLSGYNLWTGINKDERHAYLDESELDDLIDFLRNCESKWKSEKPIYQTQYQFETLGNFKIIFWTAKNKSEWTYEVKFAAYTYDKEELLEQLQSNELLNVLIQVKIELDNH